MLRSIPSGEAGLLVTCFSKDRGKLRAVVRGIRRPTSKMVGHLEPLTRVELVLARSRISGIDTITDAQILDTFAPVKASLEAVTKGIYLVELVDGFGAEDSPNPHIYSLLVDTLRFLGESPGLELTLRYFEIHLLKSSGFMPELHQCVECSEQLLPERHRFSPERGGTLCLRCAPPGARILPVSLRALKVLRFLDGAALPDLLRLKVHHNLGEELSYLLSVTLRYWLDREIQSKSFLEHLQHRQRTEVYNRLRYI